MRIAVDTSAIIAILIDEPEAMKFRAAILQSSAYMIGACHLEALIVLASRNMPSPQFEISQITIALGIELIPFDAEMTSIAQQAFLKYGKGRHPAKLNFGDCMSYALAKSLGVPLLYKGGDFARTDIVSAV